MKIQVHQSTTAQDLAKILQENLPNYKVEIRKNPIFRFEYVQVAKTSFIGAWVRSVKNNTITIQGAIPSVMVRALLGGLLMMLILSSKSRKLENEISAVLQEKLI